ncbi:MAG: hypothetical protein IJI68_06700 [Eggerthellaceae bacterium]|nr:hypothetical protein [Eggerthellaceae bacterium]
MKLCQPLLFTLHLELRDRQMFLGTATLSTLQVRVASGAHLLKEIILQDAGDLAVFHGSVLFDVDLDVMERLLAPGKRKYCGTAMRSVSARVRNIKDLVPQMTADEFQGALERALLASVSLGAM